MKDDAIVTRFDFLENLAVSNSDTRITHAVAECVDDFVVEKLKQLVSGIDQIQFHVEVAEHRRVFAADNARSIDGHRSRSVFEIQDRVAVEDSRMAEVDVAGAVWSRSCRNDERFRGEDMQSTFRQFDRDRFVVAERSSSVENGDVVPVIKAAAHSDLLLDDRCGTAPQVPKAEVDRNSGFTKVTVRVDFGQSGNRRAERLAGNRADVGAVAANQSVPFNDRHVLALLCGLHRGAFAAGAGSDDDEVVS